MHIKNNTCSRYKVTVIVVWKLHVMTFNNELSGKLSLISERALFTLLQNFSYEFPKLKVFCKTLVCT